VAGELLIPQLTVPHVVEGWWQIGLLQVCRQGNCHMSVNQKLVFCLFALFCEGLSLFWGAGVEIELRASPC
jgi:hypothetical protein